MNLEKYRRALMAKEQELLTDLQRAGAGGREEPEPGAIDPADESVLSNRKETLFAQADRDTQLLNEVQQALRRIGDGSYGRCEDDGELIDQARLEALPWARFCLKHQAMRDAAAENKPVTL